MPFENCVFDRTLRHYYHIKNKITVRNSQHIDQNRHTHPAWEQSQPHTRSSLFLVNDAFPQTKVSAEGKVWCFSPRLHCESITSLVRVCSAAQLLIMLNAPPMKHWCPVFLLATSAAQSWYQTQSGFFRGPEDGGEQGFQSKLHSSVYSAKRHLDDHRAS